MDQGLLDWLVSHYGQEKMNPGLDRIRLALGPLFPSLKKCKVITIAGTNGKGETTLWLSRYLKDHSHCTWISPHIERITERFVSETGEISISELSALISECHQKVQDKKFHLSFYEFLFFVFCTWASRKNPEYILLEVGLGGRLDAVNVFDAHYLLMPSVSRDHQEYLGNRYDQILSEKLALLRKGTIFFSFLNPQYLREKAQGHAQEVGAQMIDLESWGKLLDYDFSARNQLLAYAAYKHLMKEEWSYENWRPQLDALEHRGEVWKENGEWIFFGSHNPDGLRKLIQFLHSGNYNFTRPPFDAVLIALSNRSESDMRVMLRMIRDAKLGKVIITTFKHPKAASGELMERLASQEGLDFVNDVELFVHGKNNRRVLVTGSYYFMGHVQSSLRGI